MDNKKKTQASTPKGGFEKTLKPEVDRYTEILLKEFQKEDILIEVPDDSGSEYHFIYGSAGPNFQTPEISDNVTARQLYELRGICQRVYLYLNYTDSQDVSGLKLTAVITKLETRGALKAPWKTDPYVMDILDKMDVLLRDDEMLKAAELTLKKHNIRIDPLIAQLLDFFGKQITWNCFKSANYEIETKEQDGLDSMLSRNEEIAPELLLFNFKFRKGLQNLDEDSILEPINYLSRNTYLVTKSFFFLQIIFTNESSDTFDKTQFKIRQILDKYENLRHYQEKIKFILIPTEHINLLENECNDFKEKKIQLERTYTFLSAEPPKGKEELNDRFYDQSFDIRNNNIEVKLNPNNTPTWRFGFRFSTSENTQMLKSGRHDMGTYKDIHIGVGDLDKNNQWINTKFLYLTNYAEGNTGVVQRIMENYDGSPIYMRIENIGLTHINLSLSVNNIQIVNKTYTIAHYKYCKLFAWRDFADFGLTAYIKVTYLNRNKPPTIG